MSGHIRPKKRSPAAGATTSSNHQEVEETRQRLERWTGLQNQQQPEKPHSPPTSSEAIAFTTTENDLPVIQQSTSTPSSKTDPPSTPNSILKSKPKYSGASAQKHCYGYSSSFITRYCTRKTTATTQESQKQQQQQPQ